MLATIVQITLNGVLMGLIYSLIAIGLSLVFGVVGLINFAYSDFLMLGMYICYGMFAVFAVDPTVSWIVAVLLLGALGWVTYNLIIKKVLKAPQMSQTLATFAFGLLIRNVIVFFMKQDYRLIKNPLIQGDTIIGELTISNPKVLAAVVSVIATLILWFFLNRTKLGLGLQATSMDKDATTLMGINPHKMNTLAFVIGSACVGIAGTFLANFYYIFPYVGATFSTITFATVALGGFGSLDGAFIAGIIIGVIESFAGYFFDPAFKYSIIFLIYIIVVIVRPKGLRGW